MVINFLREQFEAGGAVVLPDGQIIIGPAPAIPAPRGAFLRVSPMSSCTHGDGIFVERQFARKRIRWLSMIGLSGYFSTEIIEPFGRLGHAVVS